MGALGSSTNPCPDIRRRRGSLQSSATLRKQDTLPLQHTHPKRYFVVLPHECGAMLLLDSHCYCFCLCFSCILPLANNLTLQAVPPLFLPITSCCIKESFSSRSPGVASLKLLFSLIYQAQKVVHRLARKANNQCCIMGQKMHFLYLQWPHICGLSG